MDLAHPISSILTPVTGAVLEVLAGTTRPLTGREIHRIASRGSSAGAWKALNRLAEQGIVIADRRPNGTHFAGNRDHLVWPAIELLVQVRGELFQRLVTEISAWAVTPRHASVFGSAARGDADESSDLDLLLVPPHDLGEVELETWDRQLGEVRHTVRRITGNNCQTVSVSPTRFKAHLRADDQIVRAWESDSILLVGTEIGDLVRELTP
jgi:predicted nucleotidyltransferase